MFLLHIRACRLESICMIVHPEAATGGVLYEKVFFKISQNSQENTGVFWHRYFPVNFTKFIRIPLLQNSFGRLLLFILLTYCSSSLIAFKQVTKQVHNLLKTIYKSPRRKNVIWRNWAEPSFISLFTGNTTEPLCFVRLIEKGIAAEDIKHCYYLFMKDCRYIIHIKWIVFQR